MITPHEAVVRQLVDTKELQRRGFVSTLAKVSGDYESFRWFRLIPDAYRVLQGHVIVYEVEDTHPVKGHRLRSYMTLWRQLEEMGWDFDLYVVSVLGHQVLVPLHTLILDT